MAVYSFNEKKKKEKKVHKVDEKTLGIILILASTFALICLITNFIGFMKYFLLGVFGLFAYPMFIVLFIVGTALVNRKKYVMTKKYIAYLLLAIISVLSIVQLIVVKNANLSFFEYLGYSYTKQLSAGGILLSLLVAPILYLLRPVGAYIFFSASSIVFIALLIDYVHYFSKVQETNRPVSIASTKKKLDLGEFEKTLEKNNRAFAENVTDNVSANQTPKQPETEKPKEQPVNIVLDATIKEENPAKRKLGLLASSADLEPISKETEQNKQPQKPLSKKEYILQGDTMLDLSRYQNSYKNRVERNIKDLKANDTPSMIENENKPAKIIHESQDYPSFNSYEKPYDDSQKTSYIAPVEQSHQIQNDNKNEIPNNSIDKTDNLVNNVLKKLKTDYNELENTPAKEPVKKFETIKIDDLPELNQHTESEPKKDVVYRKPPIELLTTESMDLSEITEEVVIKKEQLEIALDEFGIPAKVIGVVVGPAVTRYEIEMPSGIPVKKVIAHQDDIALNLAAKGDIRIEAPIPGKRAVGIEVPNDQIATVGLKDILNSPEFKNSNKPLIFSLGKDITGDVKLCNLEKMPHLLVAGATASGKSVFLNSVILSLIYRLSPEQLKLILVDPKQVEFTNYNGLPHLLTPTVITSSEMALNALNYAVEEMERRYSLFMNTRTRDYGEYMASEEVQSGRMEKIPYLVIIIDELADLLMTSKKDVENDLMRLAQKARAAGIHLILATQRPSVNVLTGSIKANFPSRITFALTSFADSKTVLDQSGAEKLLGKGDMLYKPSDAAEPRRIQGCFVTSREINSIIGYIKENNKDYDFDSKIETRITNPPKNDVVNSVDGLENQATDGYDVLMPQALKLVIENGQASISMLQRRFMIGFGRAARIIDQMQEAGYVSPSNGSKPRTVFVTMEDWEKIYGDNPEGN